MWTSMKWLGVALALCAAPAAQAQTPAPTPMVFDLLDRNRDGSISRIEWAASYKTNAPTPKGVEVVGPDGKVSVLVPRPVLRGDALDWQDPAARAQVAAREAMALSEKRGSMADAARTAANPERPRMTFESYDADGNGRVSRMEWQAFQGPRPNDP